MALVNCYATVNDVAAELGISDVDDDARIERSIITASRQIDSECGRRFWADTVVVERNYWATSRVSLEVDDISTLTGLIVKLDTDDTGTYETTLTINTDFIVAPLNAADDYPVRPHTEILMLDTYTFPIHQRRPGVSVTAKFGWAAVPTDVNQACLIQAKGIYKSTSGTFSGFQLAADAGIVMRTPSLDPVARGLLEPFRKDWIG
ncbi:MAG TPA: hypothetical protein VMY16_09465 [Ilumatobacteraceae bacterium]|nr:hypothetical protein [Ilumatobacteraceae bacterium]HUV18013.1 hypothetical protein [Ilumatobacteraceae bacterium]